MVRPDDDGTSETGGLDDVVAAERHQGAAHEHHVTGSGDPVKLSHRIDEKDLVAPELAAVESAAAIAPSRFVVGGMGRQTITVPAVAVGRARGDTVLLGKTTP